MSLNRDAKLPVFTLGFLIDLAGRVVAKSVATDDPFEAVAELVAGMVGVKVPAMGRSPEWEELCKAISDSVVDPHGLPASRTVGRHRLGAKPTPLGPEVVSLEELLEGPRQQPEPAA